MGVPGMCSEAPATLPWGYLEGALDLGPGTSSLKPLIPSPQAYQVTDFFPTHISWNLKSIHLRGK